MVMVAASESHSIRSRSYFSAWSLSRSKSGSIRVSIMSVPTRYSLLSDCSTAFLRSKVAESVAMAGLPDASVGSLYSTRSMSPRSIQK